VNPVNALDGPEVLVAVTVRVPNGAPPATVTFIGRLVDVPPFPIVAVTPVPLNVTAVAPLRNAPEITAENDVPGAPDGGDIPLITGDGWVTLKLLKGPEVSPPPALMVNVRAPAVAAESTEIVTGTEVSVTPLPIAAVTPAPLNVTAVAPEKPIPLIVADSEVPARPDVGDMPEITGPEALTVKLLNGDDEPSALVTVTVRASKIAFGSSVITIGRLVSVPPPLIDAVTPVPENVTAVAPVKLAPVIVPLTVVPGAPQFGLMLEIKGTAVVPVPLKVSVASSVRVPLKL
jgi:hypothetical protein